MAARVPLAPAPITATMATGPPVGSEYRTPAGYHIFPVGIIANSREASAGGAGEYAMRQRRGQQWSTS
jgi:hypothetical protein